MIWAMASQTSTTVDPLAIAIQIFCVATMFAMGLEITFAEAVAPLRNMLATATIVLCNNVFVPLLGFLIIAMPTLFTEGPLAGLVGGIASFTANQPVGFLLVVLASGGLLGPTLATIYGGSAAFAKGVMIVLTVVAAVLLPFELELLCKFDPLTQTCGSPKAGDLFATLLRYQLLPMAVGMVVRVWYEPIAVRLRPLMIQAAGIAFVVVLALLVFSDPALLQVPAGISQPWGFLTEILTQAEKLPLIGPLVTFLEGFLPTTINIAVMAAIASVILLIGYYGGVAVRNIVRATGSVIPRSLATSTAARNVSMALILANVHFGVADVTAVIVFYTISLIVAAHQAVRWGKEGAAQATVAQGQPAVVGLESGATASVGRAV